MNRRTFLISWSTGLSAAAALRAAAKISWPAGALVKPAALVKELRAGGQSLHILCVTFPFLYQAKHIPHAQFAGPASKPEGIAKLLAATKDLPKNAALVVYCGCCPMKKCPNILPAYETLRRLAFRNVRVLDLPDNFHTDWVMKGYPVEGEHE